MKRARYLPANEANQKCKTHVAPRAREALRYRGLARCRQDAEAGLLFRHGVTDPVQSMRSFVHAPVYA
ncbi:hypothetical protein NDU88_009028 [Pleurodeles waltl]|uniref:Uncharacterized protein n=1 Tax=Pleurodeles waltl TaxID=8319 RepID=A0AAV7RYK6_PLEWA|nr:hypothetical protein NDU88_009028 [Pleurodeles waltl]